MSTETHTVMDPLKQDAESATPTKEIGYASIGLALYTRGGKSSHPHGHSRGGYEKTDEETDEEIDDIRNTGAPTANWTGIQQKTAGEKSSSEKERKQKRRKR
ncbi:hypothetical protein BDD12DRAFT_892430 [Trichophaea hybrida]|nr:hypothetical protein BDD12DRAFT_892430 [Trichophaea hybrida]